MKDYKTNAASLIILNYTVITGYIYSGSSYPLSHIIGYSLGKEDYSFYKFVIRTYSILNSIVCFLLVIITIYFEHEILSFYTNHNEIMEIASPVLFIYGCFMTVDCFNVMMQSILRGSGKQDIPSIWNIICTISVTIPVALFLSFYLNYDIIGLWMGVFCFMLVMLIISLTYVYKLDFYKECNNLKKELNMLDNEYILISNE